MKSCQLPCSQAHPRLVHLEHQVNRKYWRQRGLRHASTFTSAPYQTFRLTGCAVATHTRHCFGCRARDGQRKARLNSSPLPPTSFLAYTRKTASSTPGNHGLTRHDSSAAPSPTAHSNHPIHSLSSSRSPLYPRSCRPQSWVKSLRHPRLPARNSLRIVNAAHGSFPGCSVRLLDSRRKTLQPFRGSLPACRPCRNVKRRRKSPRTTGKRHSEGTP